MRSKILLRKWLAPLRRNAHIALVAAALLVGPHAPGPAHAQNWLDGMPGGGDGRKTNTAPVERKAEPLNDMRPDSTPWRSDVMLNATAGVIERYEKIVANGG